MKQETDVNAWRVAIQNTIDMIFDPDDPTGSFERIGELYYRDTGFLRPGKSEPMETGRDANSDENRARFVEWHDNKRRAALASLRALVAPSVSGGNENQPAALDKQNPVGSGSQKLSQLLLEDRADVGEEKNLEEKEA